MRKRANKQAKHTAAKAKVASREKLPLIEHLQELKRRIFYIVACVAVGAGVSYGFEQKIIAVLLRPSHGQHFIYTSPLGGMNFLFGVCLDIGFVVATPVIIYQLLAFMSPLMKNTTRRFLLLSASAAGLVAACGVVFGYFIGLPSALHFLLHQFTSIQVRPLITIQSYMSFVSLYMFGSALMFQLPLILLFINRIKPLKPSGLLKYERHLLVFAFIVAFIMNPTPNIIDQMLVVVPIIIMYQVGIIMVWGVNRHNRPSRQLQLLRKQDAERQAERAKRALEPLLAAEPLPVEPVVDEPETLTDFEPVIAPTAPLATPLPATPPRAYASSFSPARRTNYMGGLRSQLIQ